MSNDNIEIVSYDPRWKYEFELERTRLAASLGDIAVRIDHNGSTSVPGLAAKPIIDVQVSVRRLSPLASYSVGLERLGYIHVPHADDSFCPFFHRPSVWPHTHHVHVVEHGGLEERRTLAFRDYLRDHESIAREYELLKRSLASKFTAGSFASQQDYAEAKGAFIEGIISRAFAEGYSRTEHPESAGD